MGEFSMMVAGRKIPFRLPTIDELSAQRKSIRDDSKRFRALRKLAKDCCLDADLFAEVASDRAGAYISIGEALLRACGAIGPIEILDDEEVSEAQGKALVEFAGRGKLLALRYEQPKLGAKFELVVRCFGERELEEYAKTSDSVAACRQLVKRVMMLGTVEEIEKSAPGLFIALCEMLTEQTGALIEVELGEA
jgi:hypothetical protein